MRADWKISRTERQRKKLRERHRETMGIIGKGERIIERERERRREKDKGKNRDSRQQT